MATAQADRLTTIHRRDVAKVAGVAGTKVRTIARRANPADIDAWWARNAAAILKIVFPGFALCAELTVKYLRSHAALEGHVLDPVASDLDRDQVTTSLRIMGPVAFKTHMARSGSEESSLRVMTDQLSRTAASRVLDGDRDTVMATFADSDVMVGYRRQLNSPNPCAFCAMLASRGAVYSKQSATFEAHKPGCTCSAVPLYEREDEPESVRALQTQWEAATAGLSGRDALAAFRRARSTAAATATT
jgi:hypothetical protein